MVKRHKSKNNICDDGVSTTGAAAIGVCLFFLCLMLAGFLLSATA